MFSLLTPEKKMPLKKKKKDAVCADSSRVSYEVACKTDHLGDRKGNEAAASNQGWFYVAGGHTKRLVLRQKRRREAAKRGFRNSALKLITARLRGAFFLDWRRKSIIAGK